MIKKTYLTTLEDLLSNKLIQEKDIPELKEVIRRYPVSLPTSMLPMIQADPDGPLAKQFIPNKQELEQTSEDLQDPIGDAAFSPVEGLVHRYPDRVLFKIVQTCAVYCRFCFRREMVGHKKNATLSAQVIDHALAYIREHKEIWEVIFSGGDPFILSPRRLGLILTRLSDISHVKVIRFHTRIPVVAPERITCSLISALKKSKKTVFIALHTNHASEFTDNARNACSRLIDSGIPMISQSVLLKGVNDSPAALKELMRTFVEMRIKPYYLHHPDLAPGTKHFRMPIAEGQAFVKQLRGTLSGLCQPQYILDIPGGYGKTPLDLCNAVYFPEENKWHIKDYKGNKHDYSDI